MVQIIERGWQFKKTNAYLCIGRLLDCLVRGIISLKQTVLVVVDECDKTLDREFGEILDEIFTSYIPAGTYVVHAAGEQHFMKAYSLFFFIYVIIVGTQIIVNARNITNEVKIFSEKYQQNPLFIKEEGKHY